MSRTAKRPENKSMGFYDFCLGLHTRKHHLHSGNRQLGLSGQTPPQDSELHEARTDISSPREYPCSAEVLVLLQEFLIKPQLLRAIYRTHYVPILEIEECLFQSSALTHFRRCLTERRIIREALNTHWFARDHINDGSISRFQEFGAILQLLAGTTINLLFELSKFARNVSGMAIQHRGITSANLARVVQDNNLENHESKVNTGTILNTDVSYTARAFMRFASSKYISEHKSTSLYSLAY